jgi:hypothetical protein
MDIVDNLSTATSIYSIINPYQRQWRDLVEQDHRVGVVPDQIARTRNNPFNRDKGSEDASRTTTNPTRTSGLSGERLLPVTG